MNFLIKLIKLLSFYKNAFFLSNIEKRYILHNKKQWKTNHIKSQTKNIILIDLFNWKPWIYIWSYLSNILSNRLNAQVKYFYFDLYQSKPKIIFKFLLLKIIKIFKSFNVSKGIDENDFVYSKKEIELSKKRFNKINGSKYKLLNYKKKNIKIGHLIYDTYLRQKYSATIDFKDKELIRIFIRAEKYFNEIYKYFIKNNVKVIIPSHLCYITYGMISAIAAKKKIDIIKINSFDRGTALFRLHKISKKDLVDEPPYYNYFKNFNLLNKSKKKISLNIGKKIIEKRVSGKNDKTLPYMQTNQFSKKLPNYINIKKKDKEKIFIFPHCYLDNPHRYRHMIFSDFYDQVKFILDKSLQLNKYEWYYKAHPNELSSTVDIHSKLLDNYPNVINLDRKVGHNNIISQKPKCIITNHGTIAHEYAYFGVPVINTGDNPHINYNFCLHIRSLKELTKVLFNLNKYLKKINFDKNKIYEFMYMHYHHYYEMYQKTKYMPDEYIINKSSKVFNNPNIKYNYMNSDKILIKYMKETKKTNQNIKKYINLFLDQNI